MSSRFTPENQDTFEQYASAISTKLTFHGGSLSAILKVHSNCWKWPRASLGRWR
jgi:hypothetical protein